MKRVALSRRRGRRGLTILEVVLAMSILALGMAAVLSIFTSAAGLGTTARQRAEASAALEYVVGEVHERLFPLTEDGSAGEPATVVRAPVPGHAPLTYSVSAVSLGSPSAVLPPLYRVDVVIHWTERGRERGLEHRMLVPRSVSMGDRLRRQIYQVEALEPYLPPESESPSSSPAAPAAGPDRQP
jgi:hypothetical protein